MMGPTARRRLAPALLLAALLPALATASDAAVGLGDGGGSVVQVSDALLAQARSGDANAAETLFAADLTAALAGNPADNLVVSPASVFDALARLAPGARGGTAAAVQRALRSSVPNEQLLADLAALEHDITGGAALRIASAAWLQDGFPVRDAYASLLAEAGSPLQSADFENDAEAARRRINSWIAEHTADRIRDLLGPGAVGPLTRLVLANAVALDARWQTQFAASLTRDDPFTTPGGQRPVSTMHLTASFDYLEANGYRAVRLPYAGGRLDALVVLPDDRSADPLRLLPAVTAPAARAAFTSARVQLALPRFELSRDIDLHQPLAALGLGSLFGNPDLSGIGGDPGYLCVGTAVHRAWLSVDENGTKGAAATAIGVMVTSLRARQPELVDFAVDRPFLFVVEDAQHGVPLFVARVTDPH